MKIKELKKGMMIQPECLDSCFHLFWSNSYKIPYVSLVDPEVGPRYAMGIDSRIKSSKRVMYLGTRKDLGITKQMFGWSNQYVLINGIVAAMNPCDWKEIRKSE